MKFLQYIVMLWAYLPGLSYSEPRRNSKRMNIYDAPEPSEYVRTETDRSGHGRQIQPLACVSKTGSEKGVCMFAWNCVEAGGKHLGTCIDRFYFGSCCKLPGNSEVGGSENSDIDSNNSINSGDNSDKFLDNDVSENEISDEVIPLKPILMTTSSSLKPVSKSPTKFPETTTTTTTTPTTTTTTATTTTTTTITTTTTTTATTTTTTTTTTITTTTTTITTTTATITKTTPPPSKITTATTTTTITTTTMTTTTTTTTTTTDMITTTTATPTSLFTSTVAINTESGKTTTISSTTTTIKTVIPTTTKKIIPETSTTDLVYTTIESKSTTDKSDVSSTVVSNEFTVVTDLPRSTVDGILIESTESLSNNIETQTSSAFTSPDDDSLTTESGDTALDVTENVKIPVTSHGVIDVDTQNPDNSISDDIEDLSINVSVNEGDTDSPNEKIEVQTTTGQSSENVDADSAELPTVAPVITDTANEDITVDPVVVESADEFSSSNTDDETKPNIDSWVGLQVGPDGSLQQAPQIGGAKPENGQFYNCSVVSEGVFNCSVVDGPSAGEGIVTNNLTDIKNYLDQAGGGVGKPVIIDYGEVKEPEAPVAPAVTPAATEKPTEQTTQPTRESSTDKPLHSMTFKEACGRRPWLNATYRSIHASPRSGRKIGGKTKTGKIWKQLTRSGKIVNGEKAEYGEWPWQVSLRQWRTATFLHKCGAALLSENWAITAAHCVESVNPDELLLRMGEYDLNDEYSEPYTFQDRKVQIVASHPKFDPKTFEYDLALLRFYEPVTFQPNIIPVCIPEDDADLVGKTAWVTGWGRLYEDGPLPAVLQEVDLPIINNTECEAMYEKAGFREHIPHIFICAGYREGGKDSCEGDSGGPMAVRREDDRFMLSGIISWGIGCAEKNQPGVYTRISEFKEWINQILQY